MASQPASSSQDRLRHLKLKIKAWEKEFASKNNGKPPTRQDISANPKMAGRYSEYQKLKKILNGEDSQNMNTQSQSQVATQTPRRSTRASQTPLKSPGNPFVFTPTTRPEVQNPLDSSSAHRRLKWMTKGYVSPTPQKNGKVLGLFDKLPGMTPTPQKRNREAGDDKLLAKLTESAKKKSKSFHDSPLADSDDDDDTYTPLDPTTPSRKRRYEFQTPLSKKSKAKADEADPFATPAFFRVSQCTFELKESGSPVTPDIKKFLPNRGMIGKVKPLSTLVKELKEMQENYEDPGADVLRELEQNELFGGDEPVAKPASAIDNRVSKAAEALLPPLDLARAEEVENENAKKPPAYKKKGQKRQTRRVKIRPVRSTKTSAKSATGNHPESDSESGSDDEVEAELPPLKAKEPPQVDDNDSAAGFPDSDEFDVPEDISEDELSLAVTKPKPAAKKTQQKAKEPAKAAAGKPQKKMIKATQHANYTRMKIHHKGKKFKGKGGRGRR
ncbi:regulatory particle non-ATPase [Orbilia brochopaga]|uniref:DNA replication regulator SLD2 n=1 Tax=Orbilia brochopaga TaxID=3140254 RepID=A0AAV9VC78_9PEZI